ncbi:MAG: 4Fe-4S binding protein, partial [Planctomycetes bacterium]|nr:4Fe-4S binding protein [Planctomycetota bacterium]
MRPPLAAAGQTGWSFVGEFLKEDGTVSVTVRARGSEPVQSEAVEIGRVAKGFDLLRLPGARALILWRGFPYIFQAAMLAVFLALAVIGWGRFAPPGVAQKLYAQTNLATLLIWGVWWPAMVWIAVLFGRAWCMACPLELVSNVSERIGRRLG